MHRNGGYTYETRVPASRGGVELIEWLAATWDHSDVDTWRGRIAGGEVSLDGVVVRTSRPVRAGEQLAWRRPPWDEDDVPRAYGVVHEDDELVVVDKPSGLPTMPGGGFLDNTLLAVVRERWALATPIHRLGRGTSGLVVFALTSRARSALTAALRDGAIEKHYRARVEGAPTWDVLEIDVPIGPVAHPRLGEVFAASAQGRPARSVATVLRTGETSLVAVQIFTGRPHQIRIHLATVGHPLVGDPLFGMGGVPRSDALPGDLGYHLHAERLVLAHPADGRPVEFAAPVPEALR